MENSKIYHLLSILVLFAGVFLFFSSSLRFELLSLDDHYLITWNESIRSLSIENIKAWFSQPYFKNYIPLTVGSIAVDYAIWGGEVIGFRITNIMLHATNVVLIYLISFYFLRRKALAFLVACFFAFHPVQVEAVIWVNQRRTLLYAFFFLLGFNVLLFKSMVKGFDFAKGSFIIFVWLCAILSKPSAAAIIFVIPAYYYFYGAKLKTTSKYLFVGATFFVLFLATWSVSLFPGVLQANFADGVVSFLVVRLIAFALYFKDVLMPVQIGLYRYGFSLPLEGLPSVAFVVLFYVLFVIGFIVALKKNKRICFWMLWFFLWLLPVLNVYRVPLDDRHLYLAMIGPILLFGHLFSSRSKIGTFVLLILLLSYMPTSLARIPIWQNSETYLKSVLSAQPESYETKMSLAGYYEDKKMYSKAFKTYKEIITERQATLPYVYLNYYNLLILTGSKNADDFAWIETEFRKRYEMLLPETYQRLVKAKPDPNEVNAIIDEMIHRSY